MNNLYANVQRFFEVHFNHKLLYTDEMHIARLVAAHPKFQEYIQQYKNKFPKYKLTLFNLGSLSVQN
ncbi:hypothetical protein CSE16_18125 [Solibacillus sp. R5-41]|uniref:hypothetical protein n=1 Tax=Solibacillus sp. R5-41 TaxID=2048654 RepID=UPI000C129583|nr:hypothetical protein [Solibacillus sp. R5-41]ATP41799.1 hypothetical protein CSE16_18125 [Solibacillus sp. R5-41]